MSAHVIVFITTGSATEAQNIAHVLIEERLAACVNIIPSVTSVYRWQDQVQDDQEVLLIIKTAAKMLEKLAARVKQLHSYQVPEIIALPIVAGAQDYLHWLDEQTGPLANAPSTNIKVR